MKAPTMVIAVLALLLWGAGSSSWAAYDAFLQFGDIKGESTDKAHKDWIEISSFQWGTTRGMTGPTRGVASRESSAPSVGEIVVTKRTDVASPKLSQACATGKHYPKVVIAVRRPGGTFDFLTMTLRNLVVSSFHASSGGDNPTESVTLNFTKIEWTYAPQHPVNGSTAALVGSLVPAVSEANSPTAQRRQQPPDRRAPAPGSMVAMPYPNVWQEIQMDLK